MAKPSFFTLLLAVAIAHLLVASAPGANALQGMNLAPQVAKRAEHVNLNQRMLKKRRPAGAIDDTVPVNAADPPPAASGTQTNTTQTTTPPANNGHTNTATQTSSNGGLLGDLSQLLNGSTSSSSSSTSTSSSSTSSAPSSTSQSSSTSSTSSRSSSRTTSTVVVIQSAVDSPQQSDASQDESASFIPKPVIIGLIVAGSCVVAAAAIWTVIRKWKFSPSRHFEDRLEPINWEPKAASGVDHDPTMAALGRSASRNGSNGGRDSFYSGDGHGSVKNMSNTHNDSVTMAPDFPPPHDFTAGAANGLNAGYVDMHRGPSPAPTQYGAAGYGGHYETPNPYDAYDYNAGYGQQQRRY